MNTKQSRAAAKAAGNTTKVTKTYRIEQRIYSTAQANAIAKGTTLSAVVRETVVSWAKK